MVTNIVKDIRNRVEERYRDKEAELIVEDYYNYIGEDILNEKVIEGKPNAKRYWLK